MGLFCISVGDMNLLNLDSFTMYCVAGALKKYLRELPNPVIPVEMYSMFIDAASKLHGLYIPSADRWRGGRVHYLPKCCAIIPNWSLVKQ